MLLQNHISECIFLKESMALFYKTKTGDLWPQNNLGDHCPKCVTLTSKRASLGGLTGGRVFFVLVSVQEWRVSREGTYSKLLLRCEPPAQRSTYYVVNCTVKYLHTHTNHILFCRLNVVKWKTISLYLMCIFFLYVKSIKRFNSQPCSSYFHSVCFTVF